MPLRRTNWYVITGAPCSGKTSVIKELAQRGYRVVHEVARTYIDAQQKQGKRLEDIKANPFDFEHHIFLEKLNIEACLPENEIVFLDRAVPDSIAYFRLEGLNPKAPIEQSHRFRYKKIFFFERLTFLKDAVRSENEQIAQRLNRLIEDAYRMLHYQIVHVPILSVEARTRFILQSLQ